MTNSIAKRSLTVAVAAATILWSVGFAALVPQSASAASYGELIKGTTLSTVYYYGSDGQRYSFPNEKTFFSWFNDFSGVKTISDSELANITLAGNIVYRPGARWIKITSDEKVYAVARDGSVHWVESEAVAKGLAGDNWNQYIDDVPDVFFVDYSVGDSLTSAAKAYEGALVKSGTDTYLIWDAKKMKVTSEGMSANMFKAGFVLSGTGVDLATIPAGSDITSKQANLTDAAQMVTTVDYVTSKDVTASFSGSPAASTLISGQGVADVAHLTLTNNSTSEVKLTKVTLTRTGVSSDTTLSNVYLFDGFVRLTDAATVSSGKVTINDAAGIVTLPAGSSKTLNVRTDLASSTNGQTIGVNIAAATDIEFSSGGKASGSFPLMGSVHTIAANPTSSFATIDFATGSTATPSASSIDPQEGVRLWQQQVSVGVNEVNLQAVRFRNIGSINAEDVTNWSLYIAGVKQGSSVAQEDADGYVTFNFSSAPIMLKTGNHEVKVLADVIGGSGRTVTVGLRNSADFVVTDADYGQGVKPVVDSGTTFTVMDAGAQSVNSGSITFTKTTDSPSGNVTDTASGVTLGKWTVKAFGEKMKVESLNFYVDDSVNGDNFELRNGAVYLNGTQIGSTAALKGLSDDTAAYTTYTFGSSFIVTPGTPAILEIRSDMVDNDGTDQVVADVTLQAYIDNTATSNVQQVTTGSYLSRPSSDVAANQLTVASGGLTVAKNTSYAAQTTVDPKTDYKIGSFSVSASTVEDINLTSFSLDFDTDTSGATTDLFNLYLKYGPSSNMTTSTVKGTVAETNNSWNINYPLKKGDVIYVDVYADIDTAISDAETIISRLTVLGTAANSGASQTPAEVAGQTILIGSGAFTEFNDDHPVAAIVYDAQEIAVAKYRFSAANESYTIKELKTSVASATAAGAVSEVRLYDGSTLKATTVFDEDTNTSGTFTGLSIPVSSNASKTLTIKYMLSTVGVGGATTRTDVQNTLENVKIADSNGVEDTETGVGSADWTADSIIGNAQYVFAAIPTVKAVDLTNSTIVNGQAADLYKFTVSASGGSVAVKQFKLSTTWSDGNNNDDTLTIGSLKFYKNGSDLSTSSTTVTIQDEDGNNVESSGFGEDDSKLIVTFNTEDTVAEGETVTYVVRGTPSGFANDAPTTTQTDSVSLYFAQDSVATSTHLYLNAGTSVTSVIKLFSAAAADAAATNHDFLWSDLSGASHSPTVGSATGDWHNGYLVKNLDLDAETWSKAI